MAGASSCKVCDAAGRACLKCGDFLFLSQADGGSCVADCPAGFAKWGISKVGRECRLPFTCRLTEGCECPLGGCRECRIDAGGCPGCNVDVNATCLTCDADRYLAGGKCKKEVVCRGSKVRPHHTRRLRLLVPQMRAGGPILPLEPKFSQRWSTPYIQAVLPCADRGDGSRLPLPHCGGEELLRVHPYRRPRG